MKCECNLIISWYQKPCTREAKYRVTHKTEYQNGKVSIWSRNECSICSKREREYRYKLDNHVFINDANLDHTYPIIEPLNTELVLDK
jgi:hypothetical protein